MKNGNPQKGIVYLYWVVGLCMPSFLFVLGELWPAGKSDQGQLFLVFASAILALSAAPFTGAAACIAVCAMFRKVVDWQLKSILWLVVALSVLAVFRIDSVFKRIGV